MLSQTVMADCKYCAAPAARLTKKGRRWVYSCAAHSVRARHELDGNGVLRVLHLDSGQLPAYPLPA